MRLPAPSLHYIIAFNKFLLEKHKKVFWFYILMNACMQYVYLHNI